MPLERSSDERTIGQRESGHRGIGVMRWSPPKVSGDPAHLPTPSRQLDIRTRRNSMAGGGRNAEAPSPARRSTLHEVTCRPPDTAHFSARVGVSPTPILGIPP